MTSEDDRAGGMSLSPKGGVFLDRAGGSGEGGRFRTLFEWRRARITVGGQKREALTVVGGRDRCQGLTVALTVEAPL